MTNKELTAVQKKAITALYNKTFTATFKDEVTRIAQRDARRAAKEFSKHPSVKKDIKEITESFLRKQLPTIVRDLLKNAEILT